MNNPSRLTRRQKLALTEMPRAAVEAASLLPAAPWLARSPRGDGHTVLVLPGLGGGDRSTRVLRSFVDSLGYKSEPWNLGTNLGPATQNLGPALSGLVEDLYVASGSQKVSIVGWSLGGLYAHRLARAFPNMIRQVVTLGSPIGRSPTNAGVPSTAIFSKSDAVVPWRVATLPVSHQAENIEVFSSHMGLGFNPSVLYAIADRLTHPDGSWQPFTREGWKMFVYGAADLTDNRSATSRGS